MNQFLLIFTILLSTNLFAQENPKTTEFNSLRFALTYGGVTEQRFDTQSLSLQFNYEQVLFKDTKWTYRIGTAYARGFERALVTDTKASRLNEFTLQSIVNYNLGNYKKVDVELGAGPFVSYISGNSDRFSGGEIEIIPAANFTATKLGAQALGRITWYGERHTHSIVSYVRLANNFFLSTGFGYEIGI